MDIVVAFVSWFLSFTQRVIFATTVLIFAGVGGMFLIDLFAGRNVLESVAHVIDVARNQTAPLL